MSRNIRNAAVAFGQQVLGALSGAVGMFFLFRYMPEADFHVGVVGFAISFVGFFLAIQRAFDGAHVKRVSEGKDLARCNGTYLALNVASTLTMVGLVLGGIFVWETLLGRGFQTPLHVRALELIVVYQVLNSIGEYVRRTYEGQQNILVGQVILSTEHLVKGAAMVYVAFNGLSPVVEGARNALGIAGAYILGAAALAVVAVLLMIGQPIGRPSWKLVKSYAGFGWKTTLTSTIYLMSVNAAAVLLQLFWGARDVGWYFAPSRYVQFLPAVAGAVTTAIFPVFSALHAEGRTAPDVVQRMVRLVSLLLLPVVALAVALPEAVIHVLLSDKALPGAPALLILSLGGYVNAIRATVASKLGGVDRPEEVTKAAAVSMVATLVLGVILVAPSLFGVPLFGLRATGAALAVTLAQFAGFGQVLRAARRYADVSFPPIWRHAIMFAGTVGVLYGLSQVVDPLAFRFYHLALAAALSVATTGVLGLLTRELSMADLRTAWEIMKPSQWRQFLREEGRRPGIRDREE